MTIEEILEEYGIETAPTGHHHSTQSYINVDCPFCSPDSQKFRLGIHKSGSYSSCWICGSHSIQDTLISLTNLSYHDIREILKDIRPNLSEVVRPRGKLVLPKGIQSLSSLPLHRKYLKKRGLAWKKLERLWGVKGIAMSSRLSWRIFIPITFQGEMVSWTTRTISNDKNITRYISASPQEESISHKSILYGEDLARQVIVIVEGPIDAWAIGPGAVATLGTSYSTAQVNRMTRFPVRYVLFDSESEAQKRAKKLSDSLSCFPGTTAIITLDSGKDAAEADAEEIKKIRKEVFQ